jgi:hypothetical protein
LSCGEDTNPTRRGTGNWSTPGVTGPASMLVCTSAEPEACCARENRTLRGKRWTSSSAVIRRRIV